ncbi:unnamed protein product [Paramecium sonneborni]|uniref:Uncharacterized protein n=1 Tax=Paramecium sonneborni TaxID=65129 RepID=A0A8S1JT29_9CILI|nr:unnamed protein product [Paramecium sonneborni]
MKINQKFYLYGKMNLIMKMQYKNQQINYHQQNNVIQFNIDYLKFLYVKDLCLKFYFQQQQAKFIGETSEWKHQCKNDKNKNQQNKVEFKQIEIKVRKQNDFIKKVNA